MARVFVSHAGDGVEQAREVRGWLIEAGHEVFVDQDRRNGIPAGEQWRDRLHERLRWADAVVSVVTSAYRESRWCAAEVEIARSRGSRLLPLRAEPGAMDPALESVQHIDLTSDPVAARAELVAELRRVDAVGGAGWPDDRSPFPGLHPFGIEQQRVFFGRAEEIKELAELLRSPEKHSRGAAVLVVGPSGCGKSSLVRAGLVPAMADGPGWWTLRPIVPGAAPVTELARELATAAQRLGLDWTGEQVRRRLDSEGLVGLVEELLLAAPGGPRRRLLVVVDQAEELLTQTAPADRARFAELVGPALGGPVRLVATLRSEFLDPVLSDPALGGIARHIYPVSPLGREALRSVIEQPARVAGIGVDPALVDQLVDDTDTGEALPLLAFTLAQLAEGVHRNGQLLTARYEQLGGVQGALTRQADAALDAAVTSTGRSREEVIAELLRLVTVDEQGRPTRWRTRRDDLPASVATELDAFVERRLLTTAETDNGGVIGVAHEAFLSAWPPLREAITASATALRARRAVEHAATEWHDQGRPPGRLWGRGQLASAVADTGAHLSTGPLNALEPARRGPARWLSRRHRTLVTDRVDLSSTARDFLRTSIRRDRFRRTRGVTVLSVLLVLALIGGGVAYIQQQNAQEQQRIATARQLVAQAETLRDPDPRTALRLGIAAQRLHPGAETDTNLINILTNTRYAGTLTAHKDPVWEVAFSPDGRTLATSSSDRTVILWDLTNPAQPQQLGPPLDTGTALSVAFSPDGNTLAVGSGHTILWDVTDPQQPRRLGDLVDNAGAVVSVAFAPDGRTLATGISDGMVILWDLTDPAQPRRLGEPLTGHTDVVHSVRFSPDGDTLASGSSDQTVILWGVTDPAQPRRLGEPLTGHSSGVKAVVFSPSGAALAANSGVDTILWDLTDPAKPRQLGQPLTGHTSPVSSVAFSPDGNTLATGSIDRTVILWDLTNPAQPRQLGQPLNGHTDWVNSVAFSPDGNTLATGSSDGMVILWNLANPNRTDQLGSLLPGQDGIVIFAAFSPHGHTLATTSRDGSVILWDLADPAQPHQLGQPLAHARSVRSLAISPDAQTLATGSIDGAVILWDLTDPAQARQLGQPLPGHTEWVKSVAFSPDGHLLATGGDDGAVILWDLTDPTQPHQLGQPLTYPTDDPDIADNIFVTSVAFSPDGHILTSAGTGDTILWDLTDPSRPQQLGQIFTAHNGVVNSVVFAPEGDTLAIGSGAVTGSGAVHLWDLTDPTQPRQLGQPFTGHTDWVLSMAFSPDGHTLTTGSKDGTLILWDLTDPDQPHQLGQPLTVDTGWVPSVAFAPDGRNLATGSTEGTVMLWDLSDLINLRRNSADHACTITAGGLKPEEWNSYIPGLPYQDTCPA